MSFEYSKNAVESLRCLIPVFFLLLIKNSYFGSDKSLAYRYILSTGVVSFKFWIKLSKVLVLPDPHGPIINILNGQFSSSLLLLQILSKFNILYFV